MPDIASLIQVSDSLKKEIHNGILAGIADVEAGRIRELNEDYANDLKVRLKARLANHLVETHE